MYKGRCGRRWRLIQNNAATATANAAAAARARCYGNGRRLPRLQLHDTVGDPRGIVAAAGRWTRFRKDWICGVDSRPWCSATRLPQPHRRQVLKCPLLYHCRRHYHHHCFSGLVYLSQVASYCVEKCKTEWKAVLWTAIYLNRHKVKCVLKINTRNVF